MKSQLKKGLAVVSALFVFYDVWKITAIVVLIGGTMIFGDKGAVDAGNVGSIIGLFLGVYVAQVVYKLHPKGKLTMGIFIVAVILSLVPSIIATSLYDARQKAMQDGLLNATSTDAVLPVSILSTSDGQLGTGMYEDKYPNTVSVSNAGNFLNQISAYGSAYLVWIGPKGWTGDGAEGVDGGTSVDLYPLNGGSKDFGPHISYYIEPACVGCILGEAAPYFADAMQKYNSEFNTDGRNPIVIPQGLEVTKISPTLVTYTLPAGADGLPIHGVAYYGPDDNTPADTYYAGATFVLPQADSDLSDFLLQTFIDRMKLK